MCVEAFFHPSHNTQKYISNKNLLPQCMDVQYGDNAMHVQYGGGQSKEENMLLFYLNFSSTSFLKRRKDIKAKHAENLCILCFPSFWVAPNLFYLLK